MFSLLKNYFQYRRDIKIGPIPLPDMGKFGHEWLNPYTDTSLLVFYITRRCNLNCSFCFLNLTKYKTDFNDRSYDATADTVHRLMEKPLVRRMHGVSLFGGEPLVNRDLPNIIDAFKRYDKMISITTNGLLLKDHGYVLEKADRVSVSVYENTISLLARDLPGLKPRNPFVLTFVLTKSMLLGNPRILDDFFAMAATIPNDCLCIFPAGPFGFRDDGEHDLSECILRGTPEADVYTEKIRELKARFPSIKTVIYGPQTITPVEPCPKCTFAWWYICCDASGDISPCACATPPGSEHGNIFKDGFMMENTWNSDMIRDVRRYFASSEKDKLLPSLCKGCIHLDMKLL